MWGGGTIQSITESNIDNYFNKIMIMATICSSASCVLGKAQHALCVLFVVIKITPRGGHYSPQGDSHNTQEEVCVSIDQSERNLATNNQGGHLFQSMLRTSPP